MDLTVGTNVRKIKGYTYIGQIRGVIDTLAGVKRYVVESTSEGSLGMLYIFRASQLEIISE